MKAKYLILAAIAFLIIMPLNIDAQEKSRKPRKQERDSIIAKMHASSIEMLKVYKAYEEYLDSLKPQEVFTFTGKITEFVYDNDFILEGFYLQTQDSTYLVHFESTMGKRIQSIGTDVILRAVRVVNHPLHEKTYLDLVNITGNGKTIYANGAYRYHSHSMNPDDFRMGKGKIEQIKYNKKDEYKISIILDDNVLLQVSRYQFEKLSPMIIIGKTIEYTGIAKKEKVKKGEVMANKNYIIYCHTITIDGKQYSVS